MFFTLHLFFFVLTKANIFIKKRRAVEPSENDEGGLERDSERSEESSISITISQLREPTATFYNCEKHKELVFIYIV